MYPCQNSLFKLKIQKLLTAVLHEKSTKITGNIKCSINNVVYQLLQCKHCPKENIGKTTSPLRLRIKNHRTKVLHENQNYLFLFTPQSTKLKTRRLLQYKKVFQTRRAPRSTHK